VSYSISTFNIGRFGGDMKELEPATSVAGQPEQAFEDMGTKDVLFGGSSKIG
jgi:hypothetical protein